jgi:hypothetical protein
MSTLIITFLSLSYDAIVLALSAWWLYYAARSPVDRCFSFFVVLPLLVLSAYAISAARKSPSEGRRRLKLPIVANAITLILLILLAIFRTSWDLDFILYDRQYAASLNSLDADTWNPSQGSLKIALSQEFRNLTPEQAVFFTVDNDETTMLIVYPITLDDLDGLLSAYVYVPGDGPSTIPGKCLSGRPVRPHHANWYYCIVAYNQITSGPSQ